MLRLTDGDPVVLFDGRGGEYEARLVINGKDKVSASVAGRREAERESPLQVTLAQAISSSDKMDFTIQKAVELGVAAIHPLLTAKSLVRLSAERETKKLAHWKRVAIAACEQCGRNKIPEVQPLVPVEVFLAQPQEGFKFLLSPRSELELSKAIPSTTSFVFAAGPEAGFDADEEVAFAKAGFTPVKLGPRVRRTETAALAALAALSALRGDF